MAFFADKRKIEILRPDGEQQEHLKNLIGDEGRYVQIIVNFLHHSVKNAPEHSQVVLNISEFESHPANLSTLSGANPCMVSKQNSEPEQTAEVNDSWGLSPLCSLR